MTIPRTCAIAFEIFVGCWELNIRRRWRRSRREKILSWSVGHVSVLHIHAATHIHAYFPITNIVILHMNMWPLEIAHSKATPSNKNALPRKTKRRKGCKSCCTHLIWWLIHVCWASFSMPLPQLLPPPSGLLSSRSESLRSKVRHSLCPLLEKAAPPRLHFGQKLVLPIRAPTVQRLTNLMYFLTYFITNYQSRFCLFSVCSNIYIYLSEE